MRKLLCLAFLFLSALGFCQNTATVSGHTVTGSGVASTSGIAILWDLTNDGGQQCSVGGVGLITPMSLLVTPAQIVAGITMYKNSAITCGTTTGGTRWRYTIKANGVGTRSCTLNITGDTNLDTATCLNAAPTPTIAVPTSNLFWLLDGSNFPTGNFIPAVNGTQAIGSSSFRWNMFANTANITNLTVGTCTGCGGGGGSGTVTNTLGALTSGQLVFGNGTVDVKTGINPSDCSAGSYATGIDATGAATGCTPEHVGTVTSVATTGPITGGTITATGTIACATCGVTGSPLSQFAPTTSAQLAGVVSDESGTGALIFAGGNIGAATATSLAASGNVNALSFQFTRRMVDQEAGADAGAKLNNCIVNITNGLNGAFGGVCDMSNMQGFISAAATVTVNHDLVTIILPCNAVFTLAGSPGINWTNSGGALLGCAYQSTILTTSSGTADVLALATTATKNRFSDFNIQSAAVRTAGSGLRVSGGDNDFERIWIMPTWNGVSLDTASSSGGNTFRGMRFSGGGTGAAWNCMVKTGGVATGNVASNSFAQTVMFSNGGTIADAMWCVQDGTDSLDIVDGQAVANIGGNDAIAMHFELVAAGNPPSNIRIVQLSMEGGITKPAMKIDSVFGMECTGCTMQSSLQGLLANAGTRIKINGGLFFNNQQEGVRDNNTAVTDLQVLGARFCNNGLGTTNTFSDFFAVAATTGFSVEHNRFLACQAGGNAPKNNVEIAAGASNNYYINDNTLAGSVGAAILDGGTGTSKRICNIGIGCTFDNFANKYGQADTVADSGAINTTETIIVKTPALVANRLIAGTHIRMTLTGTCTASAANTSTFTIRMGTLGTTGDAAIATPVTAVSAITGTNIPFKAIFDFTIRTTGASGTGFITMELVNQGTTGISTLGDQLIMPTMSTFNTTTASNILSISYKSAATTTTSTFKQGVIEIIQN